MASRQKLERTISSTQDMSSIVGTMKSLAAVNARIFGRAQQSIERYLDGVESGFRVLLRKGGDLAASVSTERSSENHDPEDHTALFVIGAVQGMCGQFSEHAAKHAAKFAARAGGELTVIAVGPRIGDRLTDFGMHVDHTIAMRGSLTSLPEVVDECILLTDELRRTGASRAIACYNRRSEHPAYEPHHELVLPISSSWLRRIAGQQWQSSRIPQPIGPLEVLLGSLTRQYLFASFYRAAAHSLAAENAARLASMQSAQKNIEQRLDELRARHNQLRQIKITNEILDIVSGYEALRGSGNL